MNKRQYAFGSFAGLIVAPLLSVFSSAAVAAPPNLWWEHLDPMAIDPSLCVNKSKTLLTAKMRGKIEVVETTVRSRDDKSVAVVECLKDGTNTAVVVLVASSSLEDGNKLFGSLKDGLKTLAK